MTVRTNAVQTCDRCLKPFNEKHLKAGDEVPIFKQKGLVITGTSGTNKDPEPKTTPILTFDDICPDCQNAVDNLIAKIRLDGTKPKKKGVAKKRGSKKKEKPKPPVETYSEKKTEEEAEAKGSEEPTEKPGPDGEPATSSEEPQESQEAKAEETETAEEPTEENSEPEAETAPETTEEPPAEAEAEADSGNGAEAGSDDDNLMTDPATGDVYDKTTGEVVSKGNSGESEKHPF